MPAPALTFAIPPSIGLEALRPLARHLADVLSEVGFTTVWPVSTYDQLESALLAGEVHAAWAPPGICARIERAGGITRYRAIRGGANAYRSALLCRAERSIDLKRLANLGPFSTLRAAWVDPRSAAGCLMPRRYLRDRGADVAAVLDERYLGSYRACFDAVLEGDADLTASYVGRRGSGYVELCGSYAAELRILTWTDEIPNDGVVVSPALSAEAERQVDRALVAAFASVRRAPALTAAFDADGFEVPTSSSYDSLLALLDEADDVHDLDPLSELAISAA